MCISVQPLSTASLAAGEDLLVAHHVALRVAQVGAERAEHAAIDADVGRVEVRVDVVVGEVAVLPLADQVGQLADFGQRHVGPLENEAVVERQPLAGFDLFADGFQDGRRGAEHGSSMSDAGSWPRADSSTRPEPSPSRGGTGSSYSTLSVSHAMYKQVQAADHKQADADDGIDVEKRGIHAGKVVGPHEQMFVNQQHGDGRDASPDRSSRSSG